MTARIPVVTRSRREGRGFGSRPLRTEWPGGARCVVSITLNFDGPSRDITQGIRPLGIRSQGHYSGRRGVRRQLDLPDHHHITGSFFIPGCDAECYPGLAMVAFARERRR